MQLVLTQNVRSKFFPFLGGQVVKPKNVENTKCWTKTKSRRKNKCTVHLNARQKKRVNNCSLWRPCWKLAANNLQPECLQSQQYPSIPLGLHSAPLGPRRFRSAPPVPQVWILCIQNVNTQCVCLHVIAFSFKKRWNTIKTDGSGSPDPGQAAAKTNV